MKNLVKLSMMSFMVIAFASCQKDDFNDVTPTSANSNAVELRASHDGLLDEFGGEIFTDKDKCKKCHSTPKSMGVETLGIDWQAPYMSDSRYNSIEDVVNNFDFVNNVHFNTMSKSANPTINETEKQDLINYLKNIASEANKGR